MQSLPNLMERPDLFLLIMIGALLVFVIVIGIVSVFFPSAAKRQFIKELISNAVIQERLKDPQVNVVELIDKIMQRTEERQSPKGISAILEKINQDITWDVSGLIGVIVTVVLMTLVVTQKYDAIPREIFAGWTTILGFYFGKAVRK